ALAPDGVGDDAARHIRDRPRDVLARHDEADLAVAERELLADDRKQQVERRRIPMGKPMAHRDEPYLAKRPRLLGRGDDGGVPGFPAFFKTVSSNSLLHFGDSSSVRIGS